MVQKDGLEWVAEAFGIRPRWMIEPNVAKVEELACKHLNLEQNAPCNVTFHNQGGFNKLYKVETKDSCYLMRVTLPVDPFNKTNSEVATINFVRQNTDMPVPKILAFSDSSDNELGFEWILMEMLPGGTLRSRWRKLSIDIKQDLVKQVAKHLAKLFHYKFTGIGNIFVKSTERYTSKESLHCTIATDAKQEPKENQQPLPVLGQLVSMDLIWGVRINQDVPRGPFTKSEDWIRARLAVVLIDQEKIITTSDDEDDIEDAQGAKDIAQRLLKLITSIFPLNEILPATSMLFHDDLSMQNILVDSDGKITGIIDWECVSALPLWRAHEFPAFLQGRDRYEEPKRDQYSPDNEEEDVDEFGKEVLDNEGVSILYWEHLMEYELTILRTVFLKEMENLVPRWTEESESDALKADFELAVQNCDNIWCTSEINSWLDGQEEGVNWSLRKMFLE